MTAQDLRDTLATVLASVLGTYTAPDGTIMPAILVGLNLAPGWTVTGLECVVLRNPSVDPIMEFGGVTSVERGWRVQLKQWDETGSLLPACDLVLKAFPMARGPSVLEGVAEIIPQATFEIPIREGI